MKRALCVRVSGWVEGGTALPLSRRAREAAGLFGLGVSRHPEPRRERLFGEVHVRVVPGEVVLISGASGTGKSTLLRAIGRALQRRRWRVMELAAIGVEHDRALVDCFALPLEETLRALSLAGLSEARLMLRPPSMLSEGQQFRYRLARFMASRAEVLLADEFCANLDRIGARIVAYGLAKFVRGSMHSEVPRAAVVATSHGDLAEDLGTGQCVAMPNVQ